MRTRVPGDRLRTSRGLRDSGAGEQRKLAWSLWLARLPQASVHPESVGGSDVGVDDRLSKGRSGRADHAECAGLSAALGVDGRGLIVLFGLIQFQWLRLSGMPVQSNVELDGHPLVQADIHADQPMAQKHDRITVELVDGTKVIVPDSLENITSYVLREQGDWFEDEIRFLRRLVQPGDTVVDIGANYGVYALSLARRVGPRGRVWAFEPASETAQLLSAGAAANGLSWLHVGMEALSDREGKAWLQTTGHSELNSLAGIEADATTRGPGEEVDVTTLDHCLERFGWTAVDLLKIDAEGEEGRILKGGARFFREQSPLVMFEVKSGDEFHLELVQQFSALGYQCFRLIPGLNALVPVSLEQKVDDYLLNLFAAKPDRVAALAAAGWLLPELHRSATAAETQDISRGLQVLQEMPDARSLASPWSSREWSAAQQAVQQALAAWAVVQDVAMSMARRYQALIQSYRQLKQQCQPGCPAVRWASLARIALALGERLTAVQALNAMLLELEGGSPLCLDEPFLCPEATFDVIEPSGAIEDWLEAAGLLALLKAERHTSFFALDEARLRLEQVCGLGYATNAVQSWLALLDSRDAAIAGDSRPAALAEEPALNALRLGQRRVALKFYRSMLESPLERRDKALVHLQMSMIYGLLGESDLQDRHVRLAARIDASHPRVILDHASFLFRSGKVEEARDCYMRVIESPEVASLALGNLAAIAMIQAEAQEARAYLDRSLHLDPNNAHALELKIRLASAELRDWGEMEAFLAQNKATKPSLMLFQLSLHCQRESRLLMALDCLDRATQADPTVIAVQLERAKLLRALGRSDEAIEQLLVSLSMEPDNVDLLLAMGYCLQQIGQLESAVFFYQKVLLVEGVHLEASNLLGCCYRLRGCDHEAADIFAEALLRHPRNHMLLANYASSLRNVDRIQESLGLATRLLQLDPLSKPGFHALMFALSTMSRQHALEMLASAKSYWTDYRASLLAQGSRWGAIARQADRLRTPPKQLLSGLRPRSLRIGFLSAEIGAHVVGMFLRSFLEHYDRSLFHVTLITAHRRYEQLETALIGMADDVLNLDGFDELAAAEAISALTLDVIVETSGYTNNTKIELLALRLAPVQCHYIGFHATTGLDSIDYFIGDEVVIPAGSEPLFSEAVWRLRRPWIAVSYHEQPPCACSVSQEDGCVFGSFNQAAKFNQLTFAYWASALAAVPGSILVLKDRSLVSEKRRDWISQSLDALGVSTERLRFVGPSPEWRDHMATYNAVDICLDCTTWSGSTTVFDSLAMGTPYIAIQGETMSSRMSSAILQGFGCQEWIAGSIPEFAAIAKRMAADRIVARRDKAARQQQMLALMRQQAVERTRELESAFRRMTAIEEQP